VTERLSSVDTEAFAGSYGCAVRVTVCPFDRVGDDPVHEQHQRAEDLEADRERTRRRLAVRPEPSLEGDAVAVTAANRRWWLGRVVSSHGAERG
jgi:hypothetical protein